ncbi:MAG: chemotaxis protein CheA, partial [Leptospiraceae bacterium]|nr:chemotaxis protein CheA [Leptospiraceae bacterium]
CIHTIKGSSGIFGFERVVQFTHEFESVLEEVRSGKLKLDTNLISLFLKCRDIVSELIEDIATRRKENPDLEKRASACEKELQKYLQKIPPLEAPPVDTTAIEIAKQEIQKSPQVVQEILKPESKISPARQDLWHISIRFKPELFKNGLDPFSVLKYLKKYGKIQNLFTLTHDVPSLESIEVDTCYLGLEILYQTQETIEFFQEAFEFIENDAIINIFPPNRTSQDLLDYLNSLNERKLRLVRILLHINALTKEELKSIFELHKLQKQLPNLSRTSTENFYHLEHKEPSETFSQKENIPLQKKEVSEPTEEKLSETDQSVTSSLTHEPQHRLQPDSHKSLRVDSVKLDNLINLVGELVIGISRLNQISSHCENEDLQELTYQLTRLITNLRDTSLSLRMVPISETFVRFQRMVRELAQSLHKKVELKISGSDTELDKVIANKIIDPLTHLIRNSLDHGLETPQERLEKGKPEVGILHLNAYQETGFVVVEVIDDGRGFNKEKILQKAKEKNLLIEGKDYTDSEIYKLVFHPGFSTAENVSNISGRGVGMDVVLRNIESIRGNVIIHSEKDKGSKIQIRLPLTLSIIDGFLFRVEEAHFVIPLESLVECIEFKEEMLIQNNEVISLREKIYPLLRLDEIFITHKASTKKRRNLLIVRNMQKEVCLLVDGLVGEFQTVIKPLGKLFSNLKGILGGTILGTGEIALVLDLNHLFEIAIQKENRFFARSVA